MNEHLHDQTDQHTGTEPVSTGAFVADRRGATIGTVDDAVFDTDATGV